MPGPIGSERADIRRIMVVRDDHIGDLICSTPAFEALKKAYPQAELNLVASTYNAEVVQGNPYIDRILCYEKHKHSSRKWRLGSAWFQYRFLRSLRAENFNLAIGLRSRFSRRQAQTVFASGAPYRVGHRPDRSRYRHLSFFYNIHVPVTGAQKHEVERTLDVLKVIGIEHLCPKPLVVIDRSAKDFATETMFVGDIRDWPKIGYHISNRKTQQRWPLIRFARLIELLQRQYPRAEHLITFAPDDQERANQLKSLLGNRDRIHLVETCKIKELGAIQQHCQLFITVDGAPMHLAAALGIPTLAIFGGSADPVVWHPWGPGHRWLYTKGEIAGSSAEEVSEVAREMLAGREAKVAGMRRHKKKRIGR
ncbi:MAG: glycosyltransferase family 9 protein [Syntrophobacteria bacterium]